MVGIEFLEQVSKLQVASYVGVEDFADKFNFLITVLVIMLCTTTVTVKQYMMKPISCYMATDIGGRNLLDYVENYCWVQGTIPIAYSSRIPDNEKSWQDLESKKLLYYQWVPFVLGLQCILFYLPRLIWQMICYNRSGTDVQHLVTSASQAVHSNEDQRNKLVKHLAKTLEQMLFQQHRKNWLLKQQARKKEADFSQQVRHFQHFGHHHHQSARESESLCQKLQNCLIHKLMKLKTSFSIGSHRGILLSSLYFFVKLLYLSNSIGQLFLMRYFLGMGIWEVLNSTLLGHDWESTLLFPRVAFCVVPIRALGSVANFATAQCVLPVNMLNEKIFIFLWLWISLVTALNIWGIVQHLIRTLCVKQDKELLRKWLRISELYDDKNKEHPYIFEEFSSEFLRTDGLMIARILKNNAGDLLATEVIGDLWLRYVERFKDPDIDTKINRRVSFSKSVEKQLSVEPSAPQSEDIDPLKKPEKEEFTREICRSERRIDRARHKCFKYFGILTIHKRLGNRLWGTYLAIKALYLSNAIGQLFLMRDFLGLKTGANATFFGATIARNILLGQDWETTLVFPRVGFCIARIQHLSGPNYVAAQCVLPVNMLNERIYVFLWFWIFLAALITGFSIPLWFIRMTYMKTRTCYIKKFLKLGEEYQKDDRLMVQKFCRQFLRHDGVFLLRMIALNAGELITSEIVSQLWRIFKHTYASRKLIYDEDDPVETTLGAKNSGKVHLLNGPQKNISESELQALKSIPKDQAITPSAPPEHPAPPSYQQGPDGDQSRLAFRGNRLSSTTVSDINEDCKNIKNNNKV
ncbi:Innexin inx2 [Cichlidogyrus casuarinus]|uniref:Innexin n=1 Tax=Cichlidogyrus casuarinus TaxID=1844966 RepID=A0ABD2Q4M9_9PLAT